MNRHTNSMNDFAVRQNSNLHQNQQNNGQNQQNIPQNRSYSNFGPGSHIPSSSAIPQQQNYQQQSGMQQSGSFLGNKGGFSYQNNQSNQQHQGSYLNNNNIGSYMSNTNNSSSYINSNNGGSYVGNNSHVNNNNNNMHQSTSFLNRSNSNIPPQSQPQNQQLVQGNSFVKQSVLPQGGSYVGKGSLPQQYAQQQQQHNTQQPSLGGRTNSSLYQQQQQSTQQQQQIYGNTGSNMPNTVSKLYRVDNGYDSEDDENNNNNDLDNIDLDQNGNVFQDDDNRDNNEREEEEIDISFLASKNPIIGVKNNTIEEKVAQLLSSFQSSIDNSTDQNSAQYQLGPLVLHLLYHSTGNTMRSTPIVMNYKEIISQLTQKNEFFLSKQEEYFTKLEEYELLLKHREILRRGDDYDEDGDDPNGLLSGNGQFHKTPNPSSPHGTVSIRVTFDDDNDILQDGPLQAVDVVAVDGVDIKKRQNILTPDSSKLLQSPSPRSNGPPLTPQQNRNQFNRTGSPVNQSNQLNSHNALQTQDLLILPSEVSEHDSIEFITDTDPGTVAGSLSPEDYLEMNEEQLNVKIDSLKEQLDELEKYKVFDSVEVLFEMIQSQVMDIEKNFAQMKRGQNNYKKGAQNDPKEQLFQIENKNSPDVTLQNTLKSLSLSFSSSPLFATLLTPFFEAFAASFAKRNFDQPHLTKNDPNDPKTTPPQIYPEHNTLDITSGQAVVEGSEGNEKALDEKNANNNSPLDPHLLTLPDLSLPPPTQDDLAITQQALCHVLTEKVLIMTLLQHQQMRIGHYQEYVHSLKNTLQKTIENSTTLDDGADNARNQAQYDALQNTRNQDDIHQMITRWLKPDMFAKPAKPIKGQPPNEHYTMVYSRVMSMMSELDASKEMCLFLERHFSEQIGGFKAQSAIFQTKYAATLFSLQKMETQVIKLKNELFYWKGEYNDLLTTLDECNAKYTKLLIDLDQRVSTIEVLQAKLVDLHKSVQKKDLKIASQKTKLEEKDAIIAQLKAQLKEAQLNPQLLNILDQSGDFTNNNISNDDDNDDSLNISDNNIDPSTTQLNQPQLANSQAELNDNEFLETVLYQADVPVQCCHCDGVVNIQYPFKYEELLTIDPNFLHKALIDVEFDFSTSIYGNRSRIGGLNDGADGPSLNSIDGVVLPYAPLQLKIPSSDEDFSQFQPLQQLSTTVSLTVSIPGDDQSDWSQENVLNLFLKKQFELYSAQQNALRQSIKLSHLGSTNTHDDESLSFPDLHEDDQNGEMEDGNNNSDEWYVDGQLINYNASYITQSLSLSDLSATKQHLWRGLEYVINQYALLANNHSHFMDFVAFSPLKRRSWIAQSLSSPHLTAHNFQPIFSIPVQLLNRYTVTPGVITSMPSGGGAGLVSNQPISTNNALRDSITGNDITSQLGKIGSPQELDDFLASSTAVSLAAPKKQQSYAQKAQKKAERKAKLAATPTFTTASSPCMLTLYTQTKSNRLLQQQVQQQNGGGRNTPNKTPKSPLSQQSVIPSSSLLHVVPKLSPSAQAHLPLYYFNHTRLNGGKGHGQSDLFNSTRNKNTTNSLPGDQYGPMEYTTMSANNEINMGFGDDSVITQSILSIVEMTSGHRLDISLTNLSLRPSLVPPSQLQLTPKSTQSGLNGNDGAFGGSQQQQYAGNNPLIDPLITPSQHHHEKPQQKLGAPVIVIGNNNNDEQQLSQQQSNQGGPVSPQMEKAQMRFELKILNPQSILGDLVAMNVIPLWLTDLGQANNSNGSRMVIQTNTAARNGGDEYQGDVSSSVSQTEAEAIVKPFVNIPISYPIPRQSSSSPQQDGSGGSGQKEGKLSSKLPTPITVINNVFGMKIILQCSTPAQKDLICDMLQANMVARMAMLPQHFK